MLETEDSRPRPEEVSFDNGRLMCRWIGTKKFVRFLLQVTATRVRTVRVTA
jgi:hypothetical protein